MYCWVLSPLPLPVLSSTGSMDPLWSYLYLYDPFNFLNTLWIVFWFFINPPGFRTLYRFLSYSDPPWTDPLPTISKETFACNVQYSSLWNLCMKGFSIFLLPSSSAALRGNRCHFPAFLWTWTRYGPPRLGPTNILVWPNPPAFRKARTIISQPNPPWIS